MSETVFGEGESNHDENYQPHNFSVQYPRAHALSRRIEKAIFMNVTAQYASTQYQVINKKYKVCRKRLMCTF